MARIVTEFFRRYEKLMEEQGSVSAFWDKVGSDKTAGYIRDAKRKRRMPPPTQLKKLEGYLDNQFLINFYLNVCSSIAIIIQIAIWNVLGN